MFPKRDKKPPLKEVYFLLKINIPPGGKVCLPQKILTVARSAKRGLLLEVISEQNKPYPLLLRSNEDNSSLYAVHKCFAVEKEKPCRHLRTGVYLAERWLNKALPWTIEVEVRWLKDEELIAKEDLTPILLNKPGQFKTILLKK